MLQVVIEPSALVCPDNPTPQQLIAWAEDLLSCRDLEAVNVRFLIHDALVDWLELHHAWPNYQTLQAQTRAYGLPIDALFHTLVNFIEQATLYEEQTGAGLFLAENIQIEPAIDQELEDLYIFAALLQDPLKHPVAVFSHQPAQSPFTLSLQANITDFEYRQSENIQMVFPLMLNSQLKVKTSIKSLWADKALLSELEPVSLLKKADSQAKIEGALALHLYLHYGSGSPIKLPEHITIHPNLHKSLKKLVGSLNQTFLRELLIAMAEAAEGILPNKEHELRSSSGGEASAFRRKTDGALSWRRNVTSGGRLHLWRKGISVEFAWVVGPGHEDFYIPE